MTQRPIKFRAWDIENKQWSEDFLGVDFNGKPLYNGEDDMYPDIVISESTGLFDKNGKEIWEGDILNVDWKDKRYPKHTIGPVEFDKEEAQFVLGEGGNQKRDAKNYMEVVGNIYENPELLS